MIAYILGAGASRHADYPLASKLLHGLAGWLDHCDVREQWVGECRNRIVQVRETFGSRDDFESILGKLEEYGHRRVKPTSATTYRQNVVDIMHDCAERLRGTDCGNPDEPAQGFYPQYLRSELIQALREFFYQTEQKRSEPTACEIFGARRIERDSTVITFNYDVALERALVRAGKWDIGTGYGFTAFWDRAASFTTIYKLHGSVNWFQAPMQQNPPPFMLTRDLKLLGYDDLVDPRIGQNDVAVNNLGTMILPDPRKEFSWEGFWSPLWGAAAERLRGASDVFIHGYSMPSADSKARELLFGNISKSATINVYCLNKSDDIGDEFRARGFRTVKPFPATGFEAWVTSECAHKRLEQYPSVSLSEGGESAAGQGRPALFSRRRACNPPSWWTKSEKGKEEEQLLLESKGFQIAEDCRGDIYYVLPEGGHILHLYADETWDSDKAPPGLSLEEYLAWLEPLLAGVNFDGASRCGYHAASTTRRRPRRRVRGDDLTTISTSRPSALSQLASRSKVTLSMRPRNTLESVG
jgi:hypothetical protein